MFEDFLADFEYGNLVWLIVLVLNFVMSVISFFKTGTISKRTKSILEEEMKYRLANYREKTSSPSQSFDTEIDQYRLNKSTNELEKLPDKLDIQQFVNSFKDSALDVMLQKLEPQLTDQDKVVDLHTDLLDSLDQLRDADDYRSEMCEKYHLDPYSSLSDVVSALENAEAVARGQIQAFRMASKESSVTVEKNDKEVTDNGQIS